IYWFGYIIKSWKNCGMLVTKKFGDACTSFGIGLLNNIENTNKKDCDSFLMSSVGTMNSIEILRHFIDKNSRQCEKLNNLLRYHEEDSEIKEICEILNSLLKTGEQDKIAIFKNSIWANLELINQKSLKKFGTNQISIMRNFDDFSAISKWSSK
ncbi:hypothetical protein MHBO_003875, partial [Bonamia ostreae]